MQATHRYFSSKNNQIQLAYYNVKYNLIKYNN